MVAPTAPRNAQYTSIANDNIEIEWDSPTDWGGEEGDYEIEINRDGNGFVTPAGGPATTAAGTESALYLAQAGADYGAQVGIDSNFEFRIRATNSDGSSGWESTGIGRTDPIPPHNVTVTRPDSSTFNFSWENRTNLVGDPQVLYFEIDAREDTGDGYGAWDHITLQQEVTDSTVTTATLDTSNTFISENARYQFRASYNTENGLGSGNFSQSETNRVDYGNEGNIYFEEDFEDGNLDEWNTGGMSDPGNAIQSGSNSVVNISGAEQGSNYLMLSDSDYIYHAIGDMSGATDVVVRFYIAAGGLTGFSDDNLDVNFYDGTEWNNVEFYTNEYNKQGWSEAVIPIPQEYISDNAFVQFLMDVSSDSGQRLAMDRVVVSDTVHEYTTLADPTNIVLDTADPEEIETSWTSNSNFNEGVGDVDYKESSASSWIDYAESSQPVTISPLDAGTQYDVRTREWVNQSRYGSQTNTWNTSFISGSATPTTLTVSADIIQAIADTGSVSETASAQATADILEITAALPTASASLVAARNATVTGDGRAVSAAEITEVFPTQSSADFTFELITDPVLGFASEWFFEDSNIAGSSAFTVMLDADIEDSIQLRVQYDETGNGDPDYTTDPIDVYRGGQPATFQELGDDGYYRIILSNMRTNDFLREVAEGPTRF